MHKYGLERACSLLALAIALLPTALCRAELAQWSEPSIDNWFYSNSFSSGSRILGPSFAGVDVDSETMQFVENSQNGPARSGTALLAFETTDLITAGLAPHRYAINSVTVSARSQVGGFLYEDQPKTQGDLLAEALGAGITEQQPIELFGVGFRESYIGFDLGLAGPGQRFAESDPAYSVSGYVAYPVIGDGAGAYHDVSNSYSGGFSETAAGNQTAPFDAMPWAIGETSLTAGQTVADDTTFSFEVDLNQPGVTAYLQQSLAGGSVGFFLSSMHPAGFQGVGGGAYPQWYMKESVGLFANAEAATLTIDFTILPLAGDYNGDGSVTPADYDSWVNSYGQTVSTPGMGADGNLDGVIDAADYTVWRDNLQTTSGTAVPEPSTFAIASISVLVVSLRRRR